MLDKNMVKSSDGTPLKKEDFRIIVKSDLIINSPYAYLSELPDDMKAAIRKAFLEAADKDKEAFARTVRRQEPAVAADRQRGLRQDHRADQVRRQSAQEGILIAMLNQSRVQRPGSFVCSMCSR